LRRALLASHAARSAAQEGYPASSPGACWRTCACVSARAQGQRSAHPPPGLCHGSSAGADPGQRRRALECTPCKWSRSVDGAATCVPHCPARQGPGKWHTSWQCVCSVGRAATGSTRCLARQEPRQRRMPPFPDMHARNWRIKMQQPCVPTATSLAGGFHGAPLAYSRTPMRWRHACRRPGPAPFGRATARGLLRRHPNLATSPPLP